MIAVPTAASPKRGLVRGLISPHPLGSSLPALFQEDDFTQRFVSAFDAVLAPIFAALDNFPAYLDPWLAPEDFLEWLGSWFGIVLDESWSLARRRALITRAFEF
jgi:phage tail-like protein